MVVVSKTNGMAIETGPRSTCLVYVLIRQEPLKIDFKPSDDGHWLLEKVCTELDVIEEIDCFGLKYIDAHQQRFWIDPRKSLSKQLKHANNSVISFEFQYYPANQSFIVSENARTLLFYQLCNDINQFYLNVNDSDWCEIAALALQARYGSLENENSCSECINEIKSRLNEIFSIEPRWHVNAVLKVYAAISGLDSYEAQRRFIDILSKYAEYGVRPISAKDSNGNEVTLGINHNGIRVCASRQPKQLLEWSSIYSILVDGCNLIVLLKKNALRRVVFKFPSYRIAKETWKYALRQKAFFTFDKGSDVPKMVSSTNIFKKRSKFQFSGRCQYELVLCASVRNTPMNASRESTMARPLAKRPSLEVKERLPPVKLELNNLKGLLQTREDGGLPPTSTERLVDWPNSITVSSPLNGHTSICPAVPSQPALETINEEEEAKRNPFDGTGNPSEGPSNSVEGASNHSEQLFQTSTTNHRHLTTTADSLLPVAILHQNQPDQAQGHIRTLFALMVTLMVIWLALNSSLEWRKEIYGFF